MVLRVVSASRASRAPLASGDSLFHLHYQSPTTVEELDWQIVDKAMQKCYLTSFNNLPAPRILRSPFATQSVPQAPLRRYRERRYQIVGDGSDLLPRPIRVGVLDILDLQRDCASLSAVHAKQLL